VEKFVGVEKKQGINVITFYFSEINIKNREEIKNELNSLLNSGETKFIIDLSKLGFIASLVIAVIVFFC